MTAPATLEIKIAITSQDRKKMIVHKFWKAKRKTSWGGVADEWLREGWFLFGIIPLYIRDRQNREHL